MVLWASHTSSGTRADQDLNPDILAGQYQSQLVWVQAATAVAMGVPQGSVVKHMSAAEVSLTAVGTVRANPSTAAARDRSHGYLSRPEPIVDRCVRRGLECYPGGSDDGRGDSAGAALLWLLWQLSSGSWPTVWSFSSRLPVRFSDGPGSAGGSGSRR